MNVFEMSDSKFSDMAPPQQQQQQLMPADNLSPIGDGDQLAPEPAHIANRGDQIARGLSRDSVMEPGFWKGVKGADPKNVVSLLGSYANKGVDRAKAVFQSLQTASTSGEIAMSDQMNILWALLDGTGVGSVQREMASEAIQQAYGMASDANMKEQKAPKEYWPQGAI